MLDAPSLKRENTILPEGIDTSEDSKSWKPLRVLNIYRLILSGLFAIALASGQLEALTGFSGSHLFQAIIVAYLSFAIVTTVTIAQRLPSFHVQVHLQAMVDITAIVMLMYSAGGVRSGLGVLLVVALAGASMLMNGRIANLFAALGSVTILISQIGLIARGLDEATSLSAAGMLGATLFATTFAVRFLAHRASTSENLALQRGQDLAKLSELNEHIIQRMQSGVIAVDENLQVQMANDAARYLLGLDQRSLDQDNHLCELSPELCRQVQQWRGGAEPKTLRSGVGSTELLPRFTALSAHNEGPTLIFLEDAAVLCQQAQEMRLTALGRLTASIAHEIRNPLSAINHAGQLLEESELSGSTEKRLTEIIQTNSNRVNEIVESVLQLSRRSQSVAQDMDLLAWLKDFQTELVHQDIPSPDRINSPDHPLQVRFDAQQLRQILTNLCKNAVLHGKQATEDTKAIEVDNGYRIDIHEDKERIHLDVLDYGPGVDEEARPRLFEPFFSTHKEGTGLGLYIARELCTSNGAHLSYARTGEGLSRFRISFPRTPV